MWGHELGKSMIFLTRRKLKTIDETIEVVARPGGRGTRLIEEPLDADGNHAGPLLVLEEGDGFLALLDHVELQVVLQVLTDPRHVLHQRNPHLFQVVSVADS